MKYMYIKLQPQRSVTLTRFFNEVIGYLSSSKEFIKCEGALRIRLITKTYMYLI